MKRRTAVRWFAVAIIGAILMVSPFGCAHTSKPKSGGGTAGAVNHTVPDFGLSVSLPQDYRWRTSDFQWGFAGTLAEWVSADGQVAGMMVRAKSDRTVEQFADGEEENHKKREGVKSYVRTSEEKLSDKKPGTWFLCEHLVNTTKEHEYRQVIIFNKQGQDIILLITWCPESRWTKLRDEIYRTARSLECRDVANAGGGSAPILPDPILALKRMPGDPEPEGLFSLDNELAFNVLDGAIWDEKRGTITLYGHWDDKYAGPRIYWLHHLAEMLDRPDPEFSLNWTPASEKRVDHFLETSETPAEVKRVTDQWGDIIDEKTGTVSAVGRIMLPILRLSVTASGAAPGTAGMQVRDTANGIRVDSVEPGSPAAAGDLRPGDIIKTFGHPSAIDARHLIHEIRASGAGAKILIGASRGSGRTQWHELVLRAAPGDPWAGSTSNDVAAGIFRAAGMKDAGDVTYYVELMERVKATPRRDDALLGLIGALGLGREWVDLTGQVNNGEITADQAQIKLTRDMIAGLDRAFQFQGNPASAAWEKEYGRSRDLEKGLGAAFEVVDQRRKEALRGALQKLLQKPEGLQIPPELIELSYDLHAEVKPEYLGVDPSSQLARVMFESDYIGKRLVNSPGLAATVPGYMTAFEFNRRNPRLRVNAGKATTYRMWISCGKLDAAESTDGSTLEVRDARMQFNIRELDANKRDLPPAPGGYEALLTSLYDPLSLQFTVLHELRECAKIAAVARWAKTKKPGLTLPKEGRAAWHGPATMPGLIWMYLYPPTGPSMFDETVMATGGCSLKLPITAFPRDDGVVSLAESPLTQPPSPDPLDPPPAGTSAEKPRPTIKRAAYVHAECLPGRPLHANREYLSIDPDEYARTKPAEFEARQLKLDLLIQVLSRIAILREGRLRRQQEEEQLAQMRLDLAKQIRKLKQNLHVIKTGPGGFRKPPPTTLVDQVIASLRECEQEVETAPIGSQDAIQSKLDGLWNKIDEDYDLKSKFSAELAKWNQKRQVERDMEKARQEDYRLAREAELNEEAKMEARKQYGDLLQQRDRLLKELRIID